MKFPLPFIIILCAFKVTSSQNWSLFNAHDKFIYLDGDSFISDVIWADSFSITGNDTTFFLNKQFKKFSNGIDSGYVAQYPFLGKAIIKQDSAFLFVQYTDTFRLEPANGLGSVWNYSATVAAEITAVDIDTIFGFPDSVKTITLSNNKTILISKNFGIIKLENKELIGIQGRNVGKTFWDIYDFEVGDVFYYYFSHDDDPYYPTQEWYERNEVFGKNWSGSLLVYDINGQNLVIGENQLPLPNQPLIAQPCFVGFFPKPVVFLKASIYMNEINLFGYEPSMVCFFT